MTAKSETQAMCERLRTVTVLKYAGLSEEGWPEYERLPNVICQEAIATITRQQETIDARDARIAELGEAGKRWMLRATELAFERSAHRQAALIARQQQYEEERGDKIDGLSSDLDSALDVLFRRGDDEAREWLRLNYPKEHARFLSRVKT